jgi:16S rRNA (uracil1498-N3)-methyltransferase
MQTFFAHPWAFTGETVTLDGDEYRHATRACRVRTGETIAVIDGIGRRVEARITSIDHESLVAGILRDASGEGEPSTAVTVALSVIRPARFETAVEQCTELGARRFIPVIAHRCETAPERLNYDRLRRISLEAAKQAGRTFVPEIGEPAALMDMFGRVDGGVLVALKTAEDDMGTALKKLPSPDRVTIVIGPEGDFTDEERDVIVTAGAVPVSLGSLTLRAETAAMAATALVTACGRKGWKERLFR